MIGFPHGFTTPTPLYEELWSYVADWWEHQLDGDAYVNVPILFLVVVIVVLLAHDRRT